jgi:hypothetical protein
MWETIKDEDRAEFPLEVKKLKWLKETFIVEQIVCICYNCRASGEKFKVTLHRI